MRAPAESRSGFQGKNIYLPKLSLMFDSSPDGPSRNGLPTNRPLGIALRFQKAFRARRLQTYPAAPITNRKSTVKRKWTVASPSPKFQHGHLGEFSSWVISAKLRY